MKDIDEEKLLHLLTEDYRANPGLYMSSDDVKECFEVEDDRFDQLLLSL